ncbi:hypothetical protein BC827DRAFT_1264570 [Russula dissimulans]|nr:hypothetical protein BC827DRAFT_1264570 [Russula dissimulans]
MAQLVVPNIPSQEPRISQLLPSVKCSSCAGLVPLDQLADHVCASAPRYKPPSDTSPTPPPKVQTAPQTPSNAIPRSPLDMFSPRRPSVNTQDRRPFDGDARLRNNASPAPSWGAPSRVPSRSSERGLAPPPNPAAPLPPPSRTQSPHLPPSSTRRRPTLTQPDMPPNFAVPPVARQPSGSFRLRSPAPTGVPPPAPAASPALPARDARPSSQRRPSNPPPSSPLAQQTPHYPPRDPRSAPMPSHLDHHPGPVRATPSPAPAPSGFPSPSPSHRFAEFDTKSGGAAGMAGVGRRGFAAVARAAMFATHASHLPLSAAPLPGPWGSASSSSQINSPPLRIPDPPVGMSSFIYDILHVRRAYALLGASFAAPQVPYSLPISPTGSLPSPTRDTRVHSSNAPPSPSLSPPKTPSLRGRGSNATLKASSIPFPLVPSHSSKPSSGPLTPTSPIQLPFSSPRKLSQKKSSVLGDTIKVVTQDDVNSSPGYASGDEESDYGGLAYAQSDASDNDELLARGTGRTRTSGRVRSSPSVLSTYSDDQLSAEQTSVGLGLETAMAALLQSPTSSDTPLSPKSPITPLPRPLKPPTRSLTSPTHAPRDSSTTLGGGFVARRGGTVSLKKERLSQESSASGLDRHFEKVLTCVRCSKDIEDKRWIRVENGRGVLCDNCWKNMYLPKCRRCNSPIEKQAVSSSDGQLKGKYHRDCFNCHTCHKPFPDKTFYVFDGKPFCDYHYHEVNNSLCAAPDCGRPIEGPCAVSHAGDRYHPEHLTCEYEDEESGSGKLARCDERLVDYWEVEGRMLCDRHLRRVAEQEQDLMLGMGVDVDVDVRVGSGLDGRIGIGKSSEPSSRAMKRKTRFIDLAELR